MKTTNKLLVKLLSRYYLTVALGCAFLTEADRHEAFEILKRIYCRENDEQLAKYEQLSENAPYGKMMTLADYERECRIIEYSTLVGSKMELTAEDRIILAAKGEALRYKQQIVTFGANFTSDALTEQLLEASSKGNIHALGVFAFMEHYGIGIGMNKRRAERNVEKAVRWNDLDAILLGLEIYPERADMYMSKLVTVFRGDDEREILSEIAAFRGANIPDARDKNTTLMEKAFLIGAVEREKYEVKFASFIYTDVMRYEDKSRIITNYKKESAPIYDDIPTHIDMADAITVDYSALEGLKLCREGEIRKIKRNLVAAHTRRNKFYRPLLIECRDWYVLDMYKQAIIAALGDTPAVMLDASLFTGADLSETKDNVFLRSVSDSGKMATAFFIESCNALSEGGAKELSQYVRGDLRGEFRLNYPQVTIDLSPCLMVLFAEGECAEAISDMCDVVRVGAVSTEEKEAVIRDILDYKRCCYGLEKLTVTDEVMRTLAAKSTDDISDLADEFAKYVACEGCAKEIDVDVLSAVVKDMRAGSVKFGF